MRCCSKRPLYCSASGTSGFIHSTLLEELGMFVFVLVWERWPWSFSSSNAEFINRSKILPNSSAYAPNCLQTKVFMNRVFIKSVHLPFPLFPWLLFPLVVFQWAPSSMEVYYGSSELQNKYNIPREERRRHLAFSKLAFFPLPGFISEASIWWKSVLEIVVIIKGKTPTRYLLKPHLSTVEETRIDIECFKAELSGIKI